MTSSRSICSATVLMLVSMQVAVAQQSASSLSYNRDVRPILSETCFPCHGPDAATREADLRLDVRDFAKRVLTKQSDGTSMLVDRITDPDPSTRMPPEDFGKSLSAKQLEVLTQWVKQDAAYQSHWAYVPPKSSRPPQVKREAWVINDIDRFVLSKLEQSGLDVSPAADRVNLIRRLSFDLIGLPPTHQEVTDYVKDNRSDAYERLVDRLLTSKHFGERLAVYWLDLVRYADTVGYHGDQDRGVSGYRDFVINSFNDNMRFDRFTLEQLAGDLLEAPTRQQRLATGYNRLNMVTREGGAQEKDYLARYAADRVRTTATVWLGSSLGCAQCHDHKFDPFTQRDFYRFAAFFADIKEKGVPLELPQKEGGFETAFPPFEAFPTPQEARRRSELGDELARLEGAMEDLSGDALLEAKQKRKEFFKEKQRLEATMLTSAITETTQPRTMRVLPRGNWMDESGEIVIPGLPEFLSLSQRAASGDEMGDSAVVVKSARLNRLDLANWLTSSENPLTARVFANRLWKLYFGSGLSRTLDDVGARGELPSHPELLDHLAIRFVQNGWDIKDLIRYIVTSATYRQSSAMTREQFDADPNNRHLARQSRFRLDAEFIRDNALSVSGLLNPQIGGRSARPYQPAGYYADLNFPPREYEPDNGANQYRRGIYTHWQRTFLHPSLLVFDAPTREECTAERAISNSPTQALALLNDPTYVEAARALAIRMLQQDGTEQNKIAWAVQQVLSRNARPKEIEVLASLYQKHVTEFAHDLYAAKAHLAIGNHQAPKDINPLELAAWTSVSRVILNLHETIHRY